MLKNVVRLAVLPLALVALAAGAPSARAAAPYQQVKLTKIGRPFIASALSTGGVVAGTVFSDSGPSRAGVYNVYSKKSKTLTAYPQSNAADVNDRGQVTGSAYTGSAGIAYVWDAVHGTTRTLAAPKPPVGMRLVEASGAAINAQGQVAGEFTYTAVDGDGEEQYSQGVLWKASGKAVVIPQMAAARAINGRGDVVGAGGGSGWLRRADGTVEQLSGNNADPVSINDAGRIAGTYTLGGASHAVLWKASTLARCDLEPLAAGSSVSLDVNNRGQVSASRSAGPLAGQPYQAVIWTGCGTDMTVLPTDAGAQSLPADISDHGDLVGSYYADATAPVLWSRTPASKV